MVFVWALLAAARLAFLSHLPSRLCLSATILAIIKDLSHRTGDSFPSKCS